MQTASQEFLRATEDVLPDEFMPYVDEMALYLELVSSYSQALNLTGYSTPAELAGGLIVEALRMLDLGRFQSNSMVIDLGSGNGCPVVPLATVCPNASFTAVEGSTRRSTFLLKVRSALGLENLSVLSIRADELGEGHAHFYDTVMSRAFAPPAEYFPLATGLLADNGDIRGYFGAFMDEVELAAQENGLSFKETIQYSTNNAEQPYSHIYSLKPA